jgi:hypothetical protein
MVRSWRRLERREREQKVPIILDHVGSKCYVLKRKEEK